MNVLKKLIKAVNDYDHVRAWPAVGEIIRQSKTDKLNEIRIEIESLQKQYLADPGGILEEYIVLYGIPCFISENGPNKLNNPAVDVFIKNNGLSVEN